MNPTNRQSNVAIIFVGPVPDSEKEIPGKLEYFEGKLREVVNASRLGWWRFHEHYDRQGYCDNPARGY